MYLHIYLKENLSCLYLTLSFSKPPYIVHWLEFLSYFTILLTYNHLNVNFQKFYRNFTTKSIFFLIDMIPNPLLSHIILYPSNRIIEVTYFYLLLISYSPIIMLLGLIMSFLSFFLSLYCILVIRHSSSFSHFLLLETHVLCINFKISFCSI